MTTQRKFIKKRSIQHSDPGKILELVLGLNEDTCAQLQIKINTYLIEECESELVFQIVVNGERMEAYVEAAGSSPLARKMKIHMSNKLSDVLKSSVEHLDYFSNFGSDLQSIISPFLRQSSKDKGDGKEHYDKKRVLMMAVTDKPFSVIVVVIAPRVMEEAAALTIHECFMFAWPTLKKTIQLEYESTLKQKCQHLLRVARRLFTQVASLETLLHIAMDQAKLLTRAEHCSVKLVDVERMDLYETASPNKCQGDENQSNERRFPMNLGIVGLVLKTGSLVNCKSAKDHSDFVPTIDSIPGVDCKTLLCFPIREQTGIIGVGQLVNKISDPYFDGMDEEMALAFSIYCGVCIVHSVVYRKIQEAHVRNALANELVMYHMKVSDTEVTRMLDCTGSHSHPHLSSLHFNFRVLPLRELPCYVMKMFSDLGLITRFQIKHHKLARFILYVKKGYRDVTYHNWFHAFNVAQWAYAAMVNFKLAANGYFTELQMLMYLIAGIAHDLDHRGTTNSFHLPGHTTLAALYSSEGSVMERHHLAQAMCILNTEGCDILEALPRRDYDRGLLLLRDFILASDLASYFKNINDYKMIATDFQKNNRTHTAALQALLMNCADLSDQLKDWGSVKKTAAAVLTEFFRQGDEEKGRGEVPIMMMDRDKCFIPELEIQFLNATCVPMFETVGAIIPKAKTCVKVIGNHIERWEAAKPVFAEVPIAAGLSILLSPELDDLIEANMQEKRLLQEAKAAAAADDEEGGQKN